MSNEDIEDIVTQLKELNIKQASLLTRLERAKNKQREEENGFRIGDCVRIINPRQLQQRTGTITKIGINRITVKPDNGNTVVRAPKNLVQVPL